VIQVEGLTYRYPGAAKPAVSDVSFEISPGEIFGLLGPSGAGKSTTQRVLTRLNRRFQGVVHVLSRRLESWDHSFYEHIGVGFELPNHYLRLTGRENLDFFASLFRGPTLPAVEWLERVGLADAADVRVGEYSKGMKMRLSFARALLNDPDVLFLDEPTAGLDPVNASVLKELIRGERDRGKTILLTTHNMADVDELCDRVGFLVEGEMSVVDAPGELKARYGSRSVRVEYADGAGTITVDEFALDGLGRNETFLRILQESTVRSLHSQEASLNRVFADVTGVHLNSEAA
jgi:fluoroquinolone transport system ATP-binding protein